jgi:hypothetical protein
MTTESQLQALATKHGFTQSAVEHIHRAVIAGNGSMAQFSHPEFGGAGQWMRGGMIMIGDMFNNSLKARVDSLCYDILSVPAPAPAAGAQTGSSGFGFGHQAPWWPEEYGSPSSTGGQNDFQYAYFPTRQRLFVRQSGALQVFDTTAHHIGGFSQQQQPGIQGFCFSSQQGTFFVTNLRSVPVGS